MSEAEHRTGLYCLNCGHGFDPPGNDEFRRFFSGESWVCPECPVVMNLWMRLLEEMDEDNVFVPGTLALGLAASTFLTYPMKAGEQIFVDLSKVVPQDATLMEVIITPNSVGDEEPLFPPVGLQRLQRQELPRAFTMHPTQFVGPRSGTGGIAAVFVLWLSPPPEPEMEPLVDAANAFGRGDYRGVVIPANIAVEAKLHAVMTAHFRQFGGKDRVDAFLQDGATYGHQLRFLMPSLFASAGAPPLPDDLTGELQRLRGLRNGVAHRHENVEKKEAARLLLAAVFGYRYLSIYGHMIGPQ